VHGAIRLERRGRRRQRDDDGMEMEWYDDARRGRHVRLRVDLAGERIAKERSEERVVRGVVSININIIGG